MTLFTVRCVFTCGVHLTSVGSVGGGGGGGLLGARAVLGEHQHQGLLSHGLPRTLLCTLYCCTGVLCTAVLLYCPRHLVAGGDGGGADVEALGHVVLGHRVLQRQHIDLVRGILTTSNTVTVSWCGDSGQTTALQQSPCRPILSGPATPPPHLAATSSGARTLVTRIIRPKRIGRRKGSEIR